MRKVLLLITSIVINFIFISEICKAQIIVRPHIGVNASRLNSDPPPWDAAGRIGFQAGTYLLMGKRVYFQPGAQFFIVRSHLVYREPGDSFNEENNTTIGGFRVPVYVGYRLQHPKKLFNVRFFAGPSAYFVVWTNNDNSNIFIEKNQFSDTIWGINAGLGIDLLWIFADVHYEHGITDVFTFSDAKLRSIALNVGLRITLGER